MKEKQLKTYISQKVVVFAVLVFLIVFGSLFDLEFSRFNYAGTENAVGQFFAAFGELPAAMAFCGAAAMVFFRRNRIHKSWSGLFALGSVVLFVSGILFAIREAKDNVPQLPLGVAIFVCVFAIAVSSYLLVKYTKSFHSRTVYRYALILFLVAFFTLLTVNIIKVPWGRARMSFIYQTGNEGYFTPWWVFGSPFKKELIAQGVSKYEFRSCPSGHTAAAACLYLLVFFPTKANRQTIDWTRFLIATIWTFGVGYSRIQMGAHFISDVAIAVLFYMIIENIAVYFLLVKHHYYEGIWLYFNDHRNPLTKKKHHSHHHEHHTNDNNG